MDQFYLRNVTLYDNLLRKLTSAPAAATENEGSETTSPDMVVSARIRPLLDEDAVAGFPCAIFPRMTQSGVADIHDLYNHPRGKPVLKKKSFNYKVDRLYGSESTTENIYNDLVAQLVPFAWNGGIGTLFAYGQTGSGKTFTINRLQQLVVQSMLDESESESPSLLGGGERTMHMTIIELAGNSAFDLLNSRQPVQLLEDANGTTQMAGAIDHAITNTQSAMSLIEHAASFRNTASTLKNDASSRSHSICRIRIDNARTDSTGYLYLVDLAGSEAARDRSSHGADRMRETREINVSLSALKDCIRGKVESDASAFSKNRKKPHVPYRQSALTKMLKHVFDPAGTRACRTVVIACVNPSLADVAASKNTLRYAELLRVVVPREEGPKGPLGWDNKQLRDWIAKNSGVSKISAEYVAPTETGAQLLRLPAAEIERRCYRSPGVTLEQARAFRLRLWDLHLAFQKGRSGTSTPGPRISRSSRDMDPDVAHLPFKERIRPGMVVRCARGPDRQDLPAGELAVVLSRADAVGGMAKDSLGNVISRKGRGGDGGSDSDSERGEKYGGERYLCGLATPMSADGAFEMDIWLQFVVDVGEMEEEVILEYDTRTRHFVVAG
ncbi:hypothetical protein QQS21_005067 [Conoideocrella luteorostrata]|uniref:Kinesin motor domain-containing protein n=1 Tax=Conoideocrella luteorostrata TaxID=1105319 RepID=A0AAJ0FU48_9HYPO|nr:hypothetical protein QQS21_005067 [Conoideocrella luteorostrata]